MPMYAADFDQRSRSPRWHEHAHQRAVGMRPTSVERAAGAVDKTAVEASRVCWCCENPLKVGVPVACAVVDNARVFNAWRVLA